MTWVLIVLILMACLTPLPLDAQPQRHYTVTVTHSLERLPDGRAQRGLATVIITDGATNQVVKRFVAAYPTSLSPGEIEKFVRGVVDQNLLTVPEPAGPLAPDTTYTIER